MKVKYPGQNHKWAMVKLGSFRNTSCKYERPAIGLTLMVTNSNNFNLFQPDFNCSTSAGQQLMRIVVVVVVVFQMLGQS